MSNWIDVEERLPNDGERVIVLIPFGMRVEDDTWTDEGWLNNHGHISHWQPIDAPGTYAEIMQRPKKPGNEAAYRHVKHGYGSNPDDWFSPAVAEHFKLMGSLAVTQLQLRLEAPLFSDRSGGDAGE
jgi:hypothetical protein